MRPTTILHLILSAQAAVRHAHRPGRIERCRQRAEAYTAERSALLIKRFTDGAWPRVVCWRLAILARNALIAETRALAWTRLAEGDAAGAIEAWRRASRLSRQESGSGVRV